MPRFQVEIGRDGESAIHRAASLLALGCSMRGEFPDDYLIWVPAHEDLALRVKKQAEELLLQGKHFSGSVALSPREGEVLKELLRNCANKEIACQLKISVRTVKFHVSSLLAKFEVSSRWDLIQKAQRLLGSRQLSDGFSELLSQHANSASPKPNFKSSPVDWDRRKEARVVLFRRRPYPA